MAAHRAAAWSPTLGMNNQQLLRYSKHIMLPELDYDGQQKISQSSALIIGVGGLGSAVALYLASSGVGKLTLIDFDKVELSNLQRQIIHSTNNIGEEKVASAKSKLQEINPEIEVQTINKALNAEELRIEIKNSDVVVEASDNFTSRFLTNRLCVKEKVPLVSGSIIRFEGQITTLRCDKIASPCYQCLYADTDDIADTCTQSGVFAPAVGVVGSFQANEALKVLADIGEDLSGRLLLFNALKSSWKELTFKRDPHCSVCGQLD